MLYYPKVSLANSHTHGAVTERASKKSKPLVRVKRVFDERCVVCGVSATGFHYSVASCNGCKTFFRRSFISGRSYTCREDNKCIIDGRDRCCCRACRYQKCIDSGMDYQLFQQRSGAPYSLRTEANSTGLLDTSSIYATNDLEVLLGSLNSRTDTTPLSLSSSTKLSSDVSIPPHSETKPSQNIIENDDIRLIVAKEVSLYALKRSGGYRGGVLLDILSRPPVIDGDLMETCEPPVFIDSQSRTKFWLNYDLSISIEYAKTHEVFRNLNFCDKCVLLEDTHVALFIFTAAYEAYFYQDKYIRYANGDQVVFEEDPGSPNDLIEMMMRCRLETVTFAISKAIILLNPDISGLSPEGRTRIEQERIRYLRLLSSYVFQQFNVRGPSILGECILLSDTAISFGRRLRQRPPANAPLLHITSPILDKDA